MEGSKEKASSREERSCCRRTGCRMTLAANQAGGQTCKPCVGCREAVLSGLIVQWVLPALAKVM